LLVKKESSSLQTGQEKRCGVQSDGKTIQSKTSTQAPCLFDPTQRTLNINHTTSSFYLPKYATINKPSNTYLISSYRPQIVYSNALPVCFFVTVFVSGSVAEEYCLVNNMHCVCTPNAVRGTAFGRSAHRSGSSSRSQRPSCTRPRRLGRIAPADNCANAYAARVGGN
jgi:hypothetical protein